MGKIHVVISEIDVKIFILYMSIIFIDRTIDITHIGSASLTAYYRLIQGLK